MLRKISFAIAGSMLIAGAAAAGPFPVSVNETGPNYDGGLAAERAVVGGSAIAAPSLSFPVSVSETGPNYGGITAERVVATSTAAAALGTREVITPMSVSETGPNYPALTAERASNLRRTTASSEVASGR